MNHKWLSRNGRFCSKTRPHKGFYRRRSPAQAGSRIETCGERSIGTKDAISGQPLRLSAMFILILFLLISATPCAEAVPFPTIRIGLGEAENPDQVSVIIQIVALLTILTLAPAILIMMTSFTRLAIAFSFLRQALGTHQMPPNQIIIGLSLFLTFFIMMPVWQKINQNAIQPYMSEEISQEKALKEAINPVRDFMFKQTRKSDLALFLQMAEIKKPDNPSEVPTSVLIPSFIISELKTAFIIGFVLYIPFLIIDMVVASILLSMGMMMLPPIMISLPFKLMLFVLVDGWNLIVGSLVKGFLGG